jgi:uncharacterized protein
MSWIATAADGVIVNVRITPRASRSEIIGIMNDALKIRLQAPPVDGKANAALIAFLADALGVARRAVTILSGETARSKRVKIDAVTAQQAAAALQG